MSKPRRTTALAGGAVCVMLVCVGVLLLVGGVRIGLGADNRLIGIAVLVAMLPGGLMIVLGGIIGAVSAFGEAFGKRDD